MVRNHLCKIRVRTNDVDVLVILTAFYHRIRGLSELWLAFGTGKSFRYIPVHIIARKIGAHKANALLMFHALTGCDSNSAFYGISKNKAWSVWQDNPQFTNAFMFLSRPVGDIPSDISAQIEEFVVRLYLSNEDIVTVNKARYELFQFSGKDFDNIPPTQDALKQHIRHAAYTAGHIWGHALNIAPALPSPLMWGYQLINDMLQPVWTTIPTISKKHLKVCHCKIVCKPPCVCAINQVSCTSLCTCRGECYGLRRDQ